MSTPPVRHGRYLLTPFSGPEIHGTELGETLAECETDFQHLLIAETIGFGRALFLDGDLMSTVKDEHLYHEQLVHPALVSHPNPRRALILGGGEGATARELLRSPQIEQVRMVELDGEVVDLCRKFLPTMCEGVFEDPRFELVIRDANDVIRTERNVDLVVHDLTEPEEGGPSCPLFTAEFFEACWDVLSDDGVFVMQGGPMKTWAEPRQREAITALGSVFPLVVPYTVSIPSFGCEWVFVMALKGDARLLLDPVSVDTRLAELGIRGLKAYDGITHTGLMHPTGHLRSILPVDHSRRLRHKVQDAALGRS